FALADNVAAPDIVEPHIAVAAGQAFDRTNQPALEARISLIGVRQFFKAQIHVGSAAPDKRRDPYITIPCQGSDSTVTVLPDWIAIRQPLPSSTRACGECPVELLPARARRSPRREASPSVPGSRGDED